MTAPAQVDAKRQSLLHLVGQAKWSDIDVLNQVRGLLQPLIEQHGPIEAWILDDSGLPKQGKQSVGVARQ